ncbi:SLAIN motif-containing protein-like isoform X1 [Denticeps clupeoides]|uniref:SLAIN motif-containing protein-like n=1 Tax=Denticeps clupeoides TaxID=299321 RepID=A0AAY4D9M6_9TELE|nr:SLAIN motif-containing protein-like isoform X1 [Denticeps clupeoides]
MVVPDAGSVVQQADNGDGTGGHMDSAPPVFAVEQEELEEVRKLQELVRRLEVQNQTLRSRGTRLVLGGGNSNLAAGNNINQRTLCEGLSNSHLRTADAGDELAGRDFDLSPPPDSSSSEDVSPLPEAARLGNEDEEHGLGAAFLPLPCGGSNNGPGGQQGQSQDSSVGGDAVMDQSALDEVDVLDLQECAEVEDEDSWLYVSPKKKIVTDRGPESPLKWCRKVLDHPSPETEVACRTLINRLDQTSRWKNMYSSPSSCLVGSTAELGSCGAPSLSPGYHKSTNKTLLTCGSSGYMSMPSALSSQSSIDSELSTSDDSISMGYKLQDLTDVQIMARLQEESLRQDYASSSASASRRSSSASLQSLRRAGTYSDQEFDTYSLEDEEEGGCSSVSHRLHRCSPSPLGSPRCQSPSGLPEYSCLGPSRARNPRRSLQGPGSELLKYAKSEEELRHSMPNLAPRSSLRSLEAVRSSRSMEANLQSTSTGHRMSRLPQSPAGMSSQKIRVSGSSPLSLRAPVKALSPMGSMVGVRQATRGPPGTPANPSTGVRRVQSPGPANSSAYTAGRSSSVGGKQTAVRGAGGTTAPSRGRLAQTPRRSFGVSKASDESWKDGCY